MSYVQEDVDDVVFLNIEYPNRVMANIHVSWLDPHKVRKITLVGKNKMVSYDDMAENKIAIYDKNIEKMAVLGKDMDFDTPSPSFEFQYRSGDILLPKINFKEPLKLEMEHFADCILNNAVCKTGIEHTKNVVRILASSAKEDHKDQLDRAEIRVNA